ncbi:dienelactone hydrolase family protein [Bythopirellula polymerisocia]|uniref:Fermentation/respiration switch protein n=1 Tax=Bythopirellula polymerisocia TaxID=2528003 RepID=A0A5C6CSH9_9BACT|nr:alpha/beta hydrolase [Bythopirellula polymerisocia]TWU26036.1 fermentation/respiration switch protein [Bythopirellula polymerisocia]
MGEVARQRFSINWLLIACLLVVFISSFLASLVQSSGGRVQVHEIKIPTQNGQWVVADLFKPRSATKKSPAPLVVVVPGFQRSKETLSNISLELARRGIVVIAIDPYAQGGSSSSMSKQSATTEGYGMFAVVNYVYDTPNLNYVDKSRIAATGHSAGGNAAIRGANYFGKIARKNDKPCILSAVFVSGYLQTLTDNVLKQVRCNVGISYALYDEGAYRNELKNGDMRFAPEALRLVNSGLVESGTEVKEVEIGRYYGNKDNRTLRVVFNEGLLHPFQPYAIEPTANQLDYFERVFEIDSGISSKDQIWYWKEFLTLVSSIAALLTLVPLARLLLKLPLFMDLVHPLPEALPRPQGVGKIIFWSLFVLSALVACFSYIPLAELSQKLFVAASSREQTWFFPQRMNNAVMLWAVFNGTVGFLLFFLSYHYHGRLHGVRPEMWGIKTNLAEIACTFLLACLLFAFFFQLLFTVHYFFHVDYRFVFFGARVFQPVMFLLLSIYAPIFFVFFLSNSLRVNGAMRFDGDKEWKSMLLAGSANTVGLLLILIVQYSVFAFTGTVYWTDGWLYVNLLFAVVPIMFILPYFNRYFFQLTGRIYLGPMATCLIFVMILLSNTVCYIPL